MASPPGYRFSETDLDRIRASGEPQVFDRPEDAVTGADAVYTDTWTSMGQEDEAERRRGDFEGFQVDAAADGHGRRPVRSSCTACLPTGARRSVDAVLDGARSRIWVQAANRMHAARGLLAWLMSEGQQHD